MNKLSRLTRNALLLIFLFLMDKIVAFARLWIINRQFSDSVDLLDAFNSANNLPDVLFALISGGSLAMAFIPLITEYLEKKDRAAAWDLFSRVANLAFVVTGLASILVAIFARPIVDIGITPGFDAAQRGLVAELMRLNLISLVIFSMSGLVMASLQANQHFLLPALAPIAYNVGQIFGAYFLAPRYGIHGLLYGVLIGAALHLLIQLPALSKFGFRWTPSLNVKNTGLVEAFKLLGPRLLTMGGIQAIVIIRDNLASRLPGDGSITALTNGWQIMQVPETVLGTAIATALLPTLAQYASRADWVGFRSTVEKALQILIALALPVSAVMIAGIAPVVRAFFSGFDEATSQLILWTTRAYLLTLTGFVIHEVAARSFYARKEPMFPLFAVLLRLVLFLGIGITAVTLFREVGAPVIALAEIAVLIEAIVLFTWLSRRMHAPLQVGGALTRGLIAALAGGATAYGLAVYVPGGAVTTSLLGMSAGGIVALVIVWKDARALLHL